MKIKKFNESLESKNESTISSDVKANPNISSKTIEKIAEIKDKMFDLKLEYEESFDEVQDYLTQYLIIHPELQEYSDYELSEETKVDTLYFSNKVIYPNSYITLIYWAEYPYDDEELHEAYMTKKDLEDFISYVKDPELYKVANKYNL